jgi:hypothetical protein
LFRNSKFSNSIFAIQQYRAIVSLSVFTEVVPASTAADDASPVFWAAMGAASPCQLFQEAAQHPHLPRKPSPHSGQSQVPSSCHQPSQRVPNIHCHCRGLTHLLGGHRHRYFLFNSHNGDPALAAAGGASPTFWVATDAVISSTALPWVLQLSVPPEKPHLPYGQPHMPPSSLPHSQEAHPPAATATGNTLPVFWAAVGVTSSHQLSHGTPASTAGGALTTFRTAMAVL